jgi:hypothetical protein
MFTELEYIRAAQREKSPICRGRDPLHPKIDVKTEQIAPTNSFPPLLPHCRDLVLFSGASSYLHISIISVYFSVLVSFLQLFGFGFCCDLFSSRIPCGPPG